MTDDNHTLTPDDLARLAPAFVGFFHWWWNQPGTNTEHGFADWANGPGAVSLARLGLASGAGVAAKIVAAIDELRREEGDQVTILCDNPDFNGQPNNAIVISAGWTNWQDFRVSGHTLLGALENAVAIKEMAPADRPVPTPAPTQVEGISDAALGENGELDAGINYAIERLCEILDVDPKSISWDAATETMDGDVMSVIGNALRAAYGEDWTSKPSDTAAIRAALQLPSSPAGGVPEPIGFTWHSEMYQIFHDLKVHPLPNFAELIALWRALHVAAASPSPKTGEKE